MVFRWAACRAANSTSLRLVRQGALPSRRTKVSRALQPTLILVVFFMEALWHHLPEHEPTPSEAEHRPGNRRLTFSVIGSAFARKCWQVADRVGRAAGAILVLRRNF